MKNNYFLRFDFQTDGAEFAPLLFSNPEKIITTNHLEEVSYCMDKIDDMTKKGYYVAGYFSYEIIHSLLHSKISISNNKMPLLWFGVFRSPTKTMVNETDASGTYDIGKWEIQTNKTAYKNNFNLIMDEIKLGHTNQINYT